MACMDDTRPGTARRRSAPPIYTVRGRRGGSGCAPAAAFSRSVQRDGRDPQLDLRVNAIPAVARRAAVVVDDGAPWRAGRAIQPALNLQAIDRAPVDVFGRRAPSRSWATRTARLSGVHEVRMVSCGVSVRPMGALEPSVGAAKTSAAGPVLDHVQATDRPSGETCDAEMRGKPSKASR